MPEAKKSYSTHCPVEALAQELAQAHAAHNAADEASLLAAGAAQARLLEEMAELLDLQRVLEDRICATRAAGPAGALAQVMVAYADFWEVGQGLVRDEQTEQRLHRRIARCLYSVRAVLEQQAGLSGDALLGRYYMRRDLDPFTLRDGHLEQQEGVRA